MKIAILILIILLLLAIGAAIWGWQRDTQGRIETILQVDTSASVTINALQWQLAGAITSLDSSNGVISRLQVALSHISFKKATPAVLDSLRTVLVPPGPKTDTTYCIDLAEARDLYEIKAKEPIKDAMLREYESATADANQTLIDIQVGVDSLKQLNATKDEILVAAAEEIRDLEDKADRPFGLGPHIGWDIRNQPTVGISVQYSLWRFRLWKKKK